MLRPLRIGLTSGDAHGIGPEVIAKALKKIGPQKSIQFFLWRSSEFPRKDMARIKKEFKIRTVSSWAEALHQIPSSNKELVEILTDTSPARWVEDAGGACTFGHLDSLATAPLSKPTIASSGLKDIGHTEILKRVSSTKNAYMTFIGKHFNVMSATGHLPIKMISEKLNPESFENAVRAAVAFREALNRLDGNKKGKALPVGVIGLNPHSGDEGLLGTEEIDFIVPKIKKLQTEGLPVVGPLIPDAAFSYQNWGSYSLYLALYHDQGLIPFKTVHGLDGVHISWGLPFIRTSPDHGTAFDIAGKDKADPTSMIKAIQWAIRLAKAKFGEV
ncbi:MAG: 4-hydroxythreonine-4-phosphate dehydrogenase PdxA [Oligoflexia bacterium]|nr:4-hydroxythreonine-4-phosphate dehydrogenase PdxA [Oligoflexia bacterium]